MAQPYDNLNSQYVSILPPSHIVNYAYKSDTKQIEYVGHAVRGAATSAAVWTIRKYTYNLSNQISTERVAHNVAWDDRETSTYA